MAYCRWSSDFGACDVYVYEDVSGGWTTHVATRKLKHATPDNVKEAYYKWAATFNQAQVDEDQNIALYKSYREADDTWRKSIPHKEWPTKCADGTPGSPMYMPLDSEYKDLEGPEAGGSFNHPTPGECAEFLKSLSGKGFRVPQYAIDALMEEQKEIDAETIT